MTKAKTYANNAERQRAYRQRLQARLAGLTPPVISRAPLAGNKPPRSRPPSRPTRLQALLDAADALRDEYDHWLAQLPESLLNSPMGERLRETVDVLDTVVEALAALEPPRGFGRD